MPLPYLTRLTLPYLLTQHFGEVNVCSQAYVPQQSHIHRSSFSRPGSQAATRCLPLTDRRRYLTAVRAVTHATRHWGIGIHDSIIPMLVMHVRDCHKFHQSQLSRRYGYLLARKTREPKSHLPNNTTEDRRSEPRVEHAPSPSRPIFRLALPEERLGYATVGGLTPSPASVRDGVGSSRAGAGKPSRSTPLIRGNAYSARSFPARPGRPGGSCASPHSRIPRFSSSYLKTIIELSPAKIAIGL